jgi:hypothetical protein
MGLSLIKLKQMDYDVKSGKLWNEKNYFWNEDSVKNN